MFRQTWLEIDLSIISRNCARLRSRVPESARLMAVVKADGYGHGAARVTARALESGADFLGVSSPEEGAQLRLAGFSAPILVLGGIAREGAEAVALYGLTQAIFDEDTIVFLNDAARKLRRTVDVHIKLDTGMGRIGVRQEAECSLIAERVRASSHLRLSGIFTHFAAADAEDSAYTLRQAERFRALAQPLKARDSGLVLHAANSAALLKWPELSFDMVRAGIALYTLEPAMRWVTHAIHVKEIPEGESVGYGCTYRAERPTRVMTVPVGYADGYHRAIGNQGRALVRGRSARVIGRVCMDQMMLDVTDIQGARVGDEVVLLGAQGEERVTAAEMAAWCGMIDYEILLSPTQRVPRVYVG